MTVQSPDTDSLYREATKLEEAVAKETTYVQDVNTDLQIKSPRVNLVVNRDRAATLGLDAKSVENALYAAYGPKWSTTIYSPTNQYRVLLEMLPNYQRSTDGLKMIYLKSDTAQLVPLVQRTGWYRSTELVGSNPSTSVLLSVWNTLLPLLSVTIWAAVESA